MNEAPTELTQEEKRIKIAIHRGWCNIRIHANGPIGLSPNAFDMAHRDALPDYFNDLNACHELLKTMTKDQCNDFNRWIIALRSDIPLANGRGLQSLRWSWGQPAEIVAEAFGKTLNLW